MVIGVLTPSLYMYKKRYSERIFAPADLARGLIRELTKRGNTVYWFTAPEDAPCHVVGGNEKLLLNDLVIRAFQDVAPAEKDALSLLQKKVYYEMDLLTRAYASVGPLGIEAMIHFHSFAFLAHFYEELTATPTLYTLHDPMPTDEMLEAWIFERFPSHSFVSISDSQRGRFSQHFFATVYNGLEVDNYPYSDDQRQGYIAVGRMVPDKGIHTAMDAVKRAGEKLTIASWVNENIQKSSYYQEYIAPNVDGSQIKINGLMTGDELVRFYQGAKALLFPIQWEEPFGMVMTEAMSTGTPVIAFNRGSVPEVIKDGVTGFIVDQDDTDRPGKGSWIIKKQGVEGLLEAMNRIGEIDHLSCRKHVEEHFSMAKMAEGYEKTAMKRIGRAS